MAVARWAVDRHPAVHQPLARRVNIVDAVRQMAEIAATRILLGRAAVFGRPIISELDLCDPILPRTGEENQREASLFAVEAANLFQPDQVEKGDGGVGVDNRGGAPAAPIRASAKA